MKLPLLSLVAVALLWAGPAAGQDAARGKALTATCVTCHGSDGMAPVPIYPDLAGQNAPYLVNALKAYRDGRRQGGTAGLMTPVAQSLSDEDIAAIAAYYASLPPGGR